MTFLRSRLALVAAVAVVVIASSTGAAFAVFPSDNVTHFTGCLNTSASPGGTFVNVTQGENPSKACGKGQILAHLSAGDITNVQTASGSGLTGGTDNGAASLTLDSTGCSSGGLLKWSGSAWACGIDENAGGTITGVTAGTGLTGGGTSGDVSLALGGGYQLPQNCGSGQVAKSNGSNGWSCQKDENTQSHAYSTTAGTVDLPDLNSEPGTPVATLRIPNDPGNYVITATESFTTSSNSSDNWAQCELFLNGNDVFDAGAQAKSGTEVTGSATEMVAQQLSVPGIIEVDCFKLNEDSDRVAAQQTTITALKVSSLN